MSMYFLLTTSAISDAVTKAANELLESGSDPFTIDWTTIVSYVTDGIPAVINILIKVGIALFVIWIGRKIIRLIRKPVHKVIEKSAMEVSVKRLVENLIVGLLYVVLFAVILGIFGIAGAISGLITAIGLVIALALQGSLSNFAGGMLIFFHKPFTVGDYIKEDTYGNTGIVEEIQMFYTKLSTYDGRTIVLPNGTLSNASLTNYTRDKKIAITIELKFDHNTDYKAITEEIRQLLIDEPTRLPEKDPSVFVNGLTYGEIAVLYRIFVDITDYPNTQGKLYAGIYDILQKYRKDEPAACIDVTVH